MSTEICDLEGLRTLYAQPKERTLKKEIGYLDDICRRFIGMSPFCVMATVSPGNTPDMTPRGGEPGFARILDEHTLLLPDRPGNNRLDNLSNLAANPAVTLLFLIPGVDETLRVYGRAVIVPPGAFEDQEQGRPSPSAMRIEVTRAYFHCPKALMRSRLWSQDAKIDRSTLPTMGEIMNAHTGDPQPVESPEEMLRRVQPEL